MNRSAALEVIWWCRLTGPIHRQRNHITVWSLKLINSLQKQTLTTKEQRDALWRLFLYFQRSFAKDSHDCGVTDLHTVHIPIHSKAPLTFVQNSPVAYESIQEMLDKLPQEQVIRECNSSYNSPIWPVLKLTGKWHLTIDNRPLNKQVPLSRWPMIHFDQELAKVKGAPFLLTVDIANGFWTMRVEPVDQYKLDFSFRNRQYTWKRCPSS